MPCCLSCAPRTDRFGDRSFRGQIISFLVAAPAHPQPSLGTLLGLALFHSLCSSQLLLQLLQSSYQTFLHRMASSPPLHRNDEGDFRWKLRLGSLATVLPKRVCVSHG